MKVDFILCLALGILASSLLLSMMRRRQIALAKLLNEYAKRQAQWARRRAKAEAIIAFREAKASAAVAESQVADSFDSAGKVSEVPRAAAAAAAVSELATRG